MWYYKDGEKEIGPVDKATLQTLFNQKQITLETLIRKAESNEWKPLGQRARVKKKRKDNENLAASSAGESNEKTGGSDHPPKVASTSSPQEKNQDIPLKFTGSGGEYFKIWIVNILLTIITLGIYSAWAKVRRKQYFYSSTEMESSSFQYLADPLKIFKGRIIVFICFVIYSLINQFYPTVGGIIVLLLLPALPWFIIRSLTFNARNSAIRNIRFNFHGRYWEAAKVFLFIPLLLPLTLGLIAPYLIYRQKKFLVGNSSFGTTRFDFDATAKDYYRLFIGLIIPFIICIVLGLGSGYFLPPISILVFVVFYLYLIAYMAVKSNNLLYNSSRISRHGFKADMAIREYAMIVFTNTLATVLTLGLYHPFATVRAYRYQIDHLTFLPAGSLDQFVNGEKEQISAMGEEFSDFMDFDFGL